MSEHLEEGRYDVADEHASTAGPHDHEAGESRADIPEDEPADMTGHPVVDEVLRSMQGLQQRPVEEHVAVFEAAHEKLRAALTDSGDRPNGPASGS